MTHKWLECVNVSLLSQLVFYSPCFNHVVLDWFLKAHTYCNLSWKGRGGGGNVACTIPCGCAKGGVMRTWLSKFAYGKKFVSSSFIQVTRVNYEYLGGGKLTLRTPNVSHNKSLFHPNIPYTQKNIYMCNSWSTRFSSSAHTSIHFIKKNHFFPIVYILYAQQRQITLWFKHT